MILDLHRQGLSLSAIARQTGLDRKTVRRYIQRGLEPPTYRPRPPRTGKITAFDAYLRERVAAYPELTARRLHHEPCDLGYDGGYAAVTDVLRGIGPVIAPGFEVRFEPPPCRQAQVDFAHFRTVFTDAARIVDLWTGHPVGVGITTRWPDKPYVEAWRPWSDSTAYDAEGQLDLYGLQALVMRAVVESASPRHRRRWTIRRRWSRWLIASRRRREGSFTPCDKPLSQCSERVNDNETAGLRD